VETIRQYLRARLVDELHLAISPLLLGSGEHLLSGIDLPALGYQVQQYTPSEAAMRLERPKPSCAGWKVRTTIRGA
jgi:dihydrofolate reductase